MLVKNMIPPDRARWETLLHSGALLIAVTYLVIGLLWIVASDWIAFMLVGGSEVFLAVSTFKGFAYVIVTALLLYALIRFFLGAVENERNQFSRSEKKYRSLVENMIDVFYQVDRAGIITYISPSFRMLGYTSPEEIVGHPITEFWADPSAREKMIAEIKKNGFVKDYEVTILRKDRTFLPVSISSRVRFDEKGEADGIEGIIRDISERKQYEQALRITNRKLQLMNIVAWHDIQNKISGLRGYVALTKDLVTDSTASKYLSHEEEILRLIHQQIAYTQEYQLIGTRPPQWMRITDIVKNAAMNIETGPVSISADVDGLEVFGDPVLEKVFYHLIDNSIEHGKTVTEITISYRIVPSGLVLAYRDDGVGIDENRKKDLFTKSYGKSGGFDLFFVHDALEISGMGIAETGEPGRGVRFEITVPNGCYRFPAAQPEPNIRES